MIVLCSPSSVAPADISPVTGSSGFIPSTGGASRVSRGRPEIGDLRDHENRRFSNDLTRG